MDEGGSDETLRAKSATVLAATGRKEEREGGKEGGVELTSRPVR